MYHCYRKWCTSRYRLHTAAGGHQTIVGSLCSGYKRVGWRIVKVRTLSFANSELACKPYIWSEKCVIPVNELKIIYPDTIILPSTILNHNDSYYLKVLLLTHNHNIPKIIVGGRIYNQKKIKLRIRKNVNFFNENKINPLTLPEVKYLRDQNWEECTTLQPHKQWWSFS